MPSDVKIPKAARDAACDAIVDLVDAGAGPGYFETRTGAPPTSPADPDSGTLLATNTCADPAFEAAGTGTDGRANANAIGDETSAPASGDAGHFRLKDSDGNVVVQGTAGEAADTPDLTFNDKSIVAGATVQITSFYVEVPEQ